MRLRCAASALLASPHSPTSSSLSRLSQVLIDGPTNLTTVVRQVINTKWLALTDFVVKVGRNARQATLTKAWTEADVQAKWAATAWAKRSAAKKAKAALTDLGRFQAKVAQQKRSKAVAAQLKAM